MPLSGLEITAADLIGVLTHVKKWISNLRRAGKERKAESRKALRSVILAVRETEIYIRQIKDGGNKSIQTERALSLRWTELSFELEDIGLTKLANRCRVTGKYWADPTGFDQTFLDEFAARLNQIEQLSVTADRDNNTSE